MSGPDRKDFFVNSELNMLKLRRETGNALRANPSGWLLLLRTARF